ncbi:restriction endonuclease [Streptomyces palmae]|uniref:Restriction endonuclease n=1 Tax=Streptomyces palmae TaxID=1701085 RepID=A0A4Z0H9U8_9ACTN|nr:restriction endonuclease [Streptomyces palmae]TGB14599.1 restriction endonuclease [Streptomyces palmae]
MSHHTVRHDPAGRADWELPLDREHHIALAKAVLGWSAKSDVPAADCEQIALQLSDHARLVADEIQRRVDQLPRNSQRELCEIVLREAARRLSTAVHGTVRCAQDRARLVRALYERLGSLSESPAATEAGPSAAC